MKRILGMAWVELIWIISAIRVFKLDFYTTAFTPLDVSIDTVRITAIDTTQMQCIREEENETRET